MGPSDQTPIGGGEDDIVPDPTDALDFEPVLRSRPKKRFGLILTLLVLAGGSAGAGWYLYGDMLMTGADADVPVIRAADGPVKVRPDNPGGMAIPDRDKLVYERLKGSEEEIRVERLLPRPEAPLAPPAPVAEAVRPVAPAMAEKPAAEPIVNPASIPKIEDAVKTAPPPQAPVVAAADPVTVYRVQLAAVRSEDTAASEWARLRKKNGDLLDDLTLNVIRIDLGADKGIFYRLQAGPLASEAAAKNLCEKLSIRKIGCLIVRPGR